jgi:hypothetical protein
MHPTVAPAAAAVVDEDGPHVAVAVQLLLT